MGCSSSVEMAEELKSSHAHQPGSRKAARQWRIKTSVGLGLRISNGPITNYIKNSVSENSVFLQIKSTPNELSNLAQKFVN